MNKRLFIILQIALALVTFAGSVYVSLTPADSLLHWYDVDDAFFYYKVAQNVLGGHGFTFDQINLSNGFHPLWMVVCLGVFWLSKFDLFLPLRVLVLVSGLFNAVTSVLLFRFFKRYIHPGAALAGALFFGLYTIIYRTIVTHGMESAISAFFIVLLLSKSAGYLDKSDDQPFSIRSMIGLGVIGALAILARLDNLFVVGAIGIFLLLKIKKFPVLLIFDLLAVSVSVFLAWLIRLGSEGVVPNTYSVYPMLIVSIIGKPILLFLGGCYTNSKKTNHILVILRVILVSATIFVFEYLLLFAFYKLDIIKMFSNSIIVLDAAISFFLVLFVHLFLIKSMQTVTGNPPSIFAGWVRDNVKSTVRGGVAFGSPIAFLIGLYMVFNKITFGTFTPVSGQIKQWWNTLENTVYGRTSDLISVLGLGVANNKGPWSLITSKFYDFASSITKIVSRWNTDLVFGVIIVIALVVFLLIMQSNRGILVRKFFSMMTPAILLGCIMHITNYAATGNAHTRSWYWIAEMLTLVIMGCLVLDWFFTWVDQLNFKKPFTPYLVGVFALFLIINHVQYIVMLAPPQVPEKNQIAYLAETKELEFYTEPGSKIGMTGGGMVAYFIEDRTIVNLDGLINSAEYFNSMKAGSATRFLDEIPLDYVYGKPYMLLQSDPYDAIFEHRLKEIGFIRGYENFTLYQYLAP